MTIDCQRSIDNCKFNKRYSYNNDGHLDASSRLNSITHGQRKLSQVTTGHDKNIFKIGYNPRGSVDRPGLGIMGGLGPNENILFPKKKALFTNKDAIFRKSI